MKFPPDPKDEPYLNLAIAAEAHYLVTRGKGLLDLASGIGSDSQDFRSKYPRLSIVDPVEFIRRVRV